MHNTTPGVLYTYIARTTVLGIYTYLRTLSNGRIHNHCDIYTDGEVIGVVSYPQQIDDDRAIALINSNTWWLKLYSDHCRSCKIIIKISSNPCKNTPL